MVVLSIVSNAQGETDKAALQINGRSPYDLGYHGNISYSDLRDSQKNKINHQQTILLRVSKIKLHILPAHNVTLMFGKKKVKTAFEKNLLIR